MNGKAARRGATIGSGDLWFCGQLYRYVALTETAPDMPIVLTRAEREVARLAVTGATAQTIARARGSSVRTVEGQLASVFRKLNLSSRSELCELFFSEAAADPQLMSRSASIIERTIA